MTRKVILRADGNAQIGLGHFTRTLALAEMLKEKFDCIFYTQNPSEHQIKEMERVCEFWFPLPKDDSHFTIFLEVLKGNEIVVLDNYFFDSSYQQSIKDIGCKLVCVDDIHDKTFFADVVINHAPINSKLYRTQLYTKLLVGINYSLLRGEFSRSNKRIVKKQFSSVMVCFGGADFYNMTVKTIKSMLNISLIDNINIIIGEKYLHIQELDKLIENKAQISLYQNIDAGEMVSLMQKSDFAIIPGSTVLLEALSQNLPAITGYYAQNQIELATQVCEQYGNYLMLGDFQSVEVLPEHINLLSEKVNFESPSISNSSESLMKVFTELSTEFAFKTRLASHKDCELYYSWVNDCEVRGNAINSGVIKYKDHLVWFKYKINDPNSILLVFDMNNTPVGQVRIDIINGDGWIDYSIDKSFRGLGYGKLIIKLALEYIAIQLRNKKNIALKANVKCENIPSNKVFTSLNFEYTGCDIIKHTKYNNYYKKML